MFNEESIEPVTVTHRMVCDAILKKIVSAISLGDMEQVEILSLAWKRIAPNN